MLFFVQEFYLLGGIVLFSIANFFLWKHDNTNSPSYKQRDIQSLRDTSLWIILISVIFRTIVSYGVISSGSMEPNLPCNSLLIFSPLPYGIWLPFLENVCRTGSIKRGDIVVFYCSENILSQEQFCKRVIGIEGDYILIQDGVLYVNNNSTLVSHSEQALDDGGYLYKEKLPGCKHAHIIREEKKYNVGMTGFVSQFEMIVPKGEVFVMGDLRGRSLDSRDSKFGTIPVKHIYGKGIYNCSYSNLLKYVFTEHI